MTCKIKLSICIATFNRSDFIAQTIDSIIHQLRPDVELVILDGNSSDNTPDIIKHYCCLSNMVRYYRQSINSGVDRDYDNAVKCAQGEFCWLMTDDDLLDQNAVSKLLSLLDLSIDLIIVNARVKDASLSEKLVPHILPFSMDRNFSTEDNELLFKDVASYLSFIGCVVIRRTLWLSRDRETYFGSLFIHVGVIFQKALLGRVYVIAEPLITIRWGNAMWTPRAFEIWMFKWPKLIWGFQHFSSSARNCVSPLEPWRLIKNLAFQRAVGSYTMTEYRLYIRNSTNAMDRLMPYSMAILPPKFLNSVASLYCIIFNRKARARLFDLVHSVNATWVTRSVDLLMKKYCII